MHGFTADNVCQTIINRRL